MKTNIRQWALSLVLSLVALSGVASAATHTVVTAPSPLAGKVSRELRTHLLYYSLFDRLSFRVDGSEVTLLGKVSWPSLKPTAERLVANIEGVTSVENQIEVLPTSFHDDRIRLATTRLPAASLLGPVFQWVFEQIRVVRLARSFARPFLRPSVRLYPLRIRYPHHREERTCNP